MTMTTPAVAQAGDAVLYRTRRGHYVHVFPRSPRDQRLYQVVPQMSDASRDMLATVDDFGNLVVTHRRDPSSPHGMWFIRVPQIGAAS